ncbi:dihydrolipoamide acetyltransferase component of pyruvate dehydrogenase complex [Klebsiella pneumoniae subsp. rhinoscleromatis]|nr:dihydrolipoamide acetyltransferase component of pyruvate dehydrogenase complex [Klebsiella pneumoniae subsp. rhinoscleromatis]
MLPWPKVDFSNFGEVEEVELGRIQKISGANLSRNWVMIPHVTPLRQNRYHRSGSVPQAAEMPKLRSVNWT